MHIWLGVENFAKIESAKVCINAYTVSELKNNLMPYKNNIEHIRNFAGKTVKIGNKKYPLHVFLLKKISDTEYSTSIKIGICKQ